HSMYSTGESVEFQSFGTTASHQVSVGGGLYEGASGGQWYDPQHARLLQPVGVPAASNPYDADTGSWWGNFWSALPSAIGDSALARGSAIVNAGKQLGYTVADMANDALYSYTFWNQYLTSGGTNADGGVAFYNGHLSAAEQAFDSGQIHFGLNLKYADFAGENVANGITFGTFDQAKASAQLARGTISWDQWGDRMAVGGAGQLFAAATMPAQANIALSTDLECMVLQSRFGAADICFVPGTQILVGDPLSQPKDTNGSTFTSRYDAGGGSAGVSTFGPASTHLTRNIEDLRVDDVVLARDQDQPFGELVPRRVAAIFRRTVYQLHVLNFRDSEGSIQAIRCTENHPFWLDG